MKRISFILEGIFIVLFVGILLWMASPILHQALIHDRPISFASVDAYAWYVNAKSIYDSGSFKYTPPYFNLGLEGFTSPEPPLFVQLTAYLTYALGINLYDTQIFLGILLVIFSILMFFITIRNYKPSLSYFSLPLCTFVFTFPFVIGLLFGVLPAIFGFLFFFTSLFMLFYTEVKYSTIIFAVLFSAMIMGHTVRMFEFIFFGGAFIILALAFKQVNLAFLKKLAISTGLALIISVYYLPVFGQRFSPGDNFSRTATGTKYLEIVLSDFGFVKYGIIIGLILCAYFLVKERKNVKSLVLTFPIITFLLVYFLRVSRVYQQTFFWPVLLGLAFGLVLFSIFQLKYFTKLRKSVITCFIINLTLSVLLIYAYYYPHTWRFSDLSDRGITPDQNQWENLMWISKNTEPNSNILFFYFNDYPADFDYILFPAERQSYYVPVEEIDLAVQEGLMNNYSIKKEYRILDYSSPFFYKRNPKFPLKAGIVDKKKYLKNMSLCDFDYVYGKRSVYFHKEEAYAYQKYSNRAAYTVDLLNMLEKGSFRLVYENDEAMILKNMNPGGACI